jgi:hypothetical protein
MLAAITIRPAIPIDHPHLREAIVELQDYERQQHATRRPASRWPIAYLDWMQGTGGYRAAKEIASPKPTWQRRLNRELKNCFGTRAYAAEELIAELTMAFLCAHLGIKRELRHADYVQGWISLRKEDPSSKLQA